MENILIQGAMTSETECLINSLVNKEELEINGYKFYKGKICDKNIIVSITKVGMINAAISTMLGILNFSPKYIINQGVAGGYGKEIHKGDIIIGKFCANMNSIDTTSRALGEGTNPNDWKLISWAEGNDIENEKISANEELVEIFKNEIKNDSGSVIVGTLASGDIWNREIDRINWIKEKTDASCEDMESFAVYKVCTEQNVPVLGIRMISNSQINDEQYDKTLAKKLQEAICIVIEKIA